MAKVSIIIPVYKVASWLDACLSSCLRQTFRDIEIIVVVDGSPDASLQIAEAYAANDDRIVIIHKIKNEGLIYARKSGIEAARGEYIFHLDGDDFIPEKAIESLYEEAIRQDADMTIGRFCLISKGKTMRVKFDGDMDPTVFGQGLLYDLLLKWNWEITGKLMHKRLYDELVYYTLSMGEDLFLMMQLVVKVNKVAFVREKVYFLNKREDSITGNAANTKFSLLYQPFTNALYFLLDRYPYEQRIRDEVSFHILFCLSRHCLSKQEKWVRDILWREFRKSANRDRLYAFSKKVYIKVWIYMLLPVSIYK